jgi:D-inositol-3-phosphate glycosyltransferase
MGMRRLLVFSQLPWQRAAMPTDFLYGAWSVSDSYARALLRYGSFDEYWFVTSGSSTGDTAGEYTVTAEAPGSHHVRVVGARDLEGVAGDQAPTAALVFSMDLRKTCYIRSHLAGCWFPVIGTTHSLSYVDHLDTITQMLLNSDYKGDAIVCATESARDVVRNLFGVTGRRLERITGRQFSFAGRLPVIPYGVDTEVFRPRDARDVRRQLGLPDDRVIALCFGRFSVADKMDLLPLLDAWRVVSARVSPEPLLILAGEDRRFGYAGKAQSAAVSAGLQTSVRVWRNPPEAAKPLLYSAADLFVSLSDSIQETFGVTITEALASQLPVICSDWNGYRDLVADEECGYRIPTYWADSSSEIDRLSPVSLWQDDHFALAQSVAVDRECLTRRLLEVVGSPRLRRRLGLAARRYAETRLSWGVIVRQLEELTQELASGGDRTGLAASGRPGESGDDWLGRAGYFECFRHYATHCLDGGTQICLSEWGRELRSPDGDIAAFCRDRYSISEGPLVQCILDCVDAGVSRPLAEIVDGASADMGAGRERVVRHVLWMIKHGILDVSSVRG